MTGNARETWTDQDYDRLSWHDNHIHGLRVVEGEHGVGELVIDIDFILEWLGADASGNFQFHIAPADLTFHEVSNLTVSLDYASLSAAMAPFSIDGIKKLLDKRERYDATIWTIDINFPAGRISFEASGFTQTLRGHAITTDQQVLSQEQRSGVI